MKITGIIMISLFLAACFKKPVNVSGVYTSRWSNEFAEVRDTIQVSFDHTGACKVTRRTFVMKDHKPEYRLAHWTGNYNPEAQTLVIQANGRILYFKENEMRMGTTIYTKL